MPTTELRSPQGYGKPQKSSGPEIPEIEDNMYDALVKDVKQGTSSFGGDISEQYIVEWELIDRVKANGQPVTLRSYIKIPPTLISDGVLNENSNLYAFLKALGYGDDDLEVDPDQWQGEKARIVVENKEIKEGDNKGQVRPRITGYKPIRRSSAAAPTPPAAATTAKRATKAVAAPETEDEF